MSKTMYDLLEWPDQCKKKTEPVEPIVVEEDLQEKD